MRLFCRSHDSRNSGIPRASRLANQERLKSKTKRLFKAYYTTTYIYIYMLCITRALVVVKIGTSSSGMHGTSRTKLLFITIISSEWSRNDHFRYVCFVVRSVQQAHWRLSFFCVKTRFCSYIQNNFIVNQSDDKMRAHIYGT